MDGTLASEAGEWYLLAGTRRYALHLGNAARMQVAGPDLRDGEPAEVRGFVDGSEVAVVSIVVNGRSYTFRGEDGTPLWAGNGRGTGGGSRRGAS